MKVDILFILDMSGSMENLKQEVISSLNNLIEDQKKLSQENKFTLVAFNSMEIKKIYDRQSLKDINLISKGEYKPNGLTPLLDAIGSTVKDLSIKLKDSQEEVDKVIVAIMTDGLENCSREFTKKEIQNIIEEKQEHHNWEFIYLGANQDAFHEAGSIGIPQCNTVSYDATTLGTRCALGTSSQTIRKMSEEK